MAKRYINKLETRRKVNKYLIMLLCIAPVLIAINFLFLSNMQRVWRIVIDCVVALALVFLIHTLMEKKKQRDEELAKEQEKQDKLKAHREHKKQGKKSSQSNSQDKGQSEVEQEVDVAKATNTNENSTEQTQVEVQDTEPEKTCDIAQEKVEVAQENKQVETKVENENKGEK